MSSASCSSISLFFLLRKINWVISIMKYPAGFHTVFSTLKEKVVTLLEIRKNDIWWLYLLCAKATETTAKLKQLAKWHASAHFVFLVYFLLWAWQKWVKFSHCNRPLKFNDWKFLCLFFSLGSHWRLVSIYCLSKRDLVKLGKPWIYCNRWNHCFPVYHGCQGKLRISHSLECLRTGCILLWATYSCESCPCPWWGCWD